MSHEATNWAFKQKGLKPATKIVLLALADRHNPDFGCFPSKRLLADDCEMSERAVYAHIKVLEDAGLINVAEAAQKHRGQYASNRYILGFEADFIQRQNQPSAKSAVGKNEQPPSAKSADDRRQNLPTNPVIEPCNGTSKGNPLCSPAASPAPETAGKRKKPPKRFCDLPEGWVPSEGNIEDARKKNLTDQEISHAAYQFANHHRSKGNQFVDWDAAWRTWIGNIGRYKPRGGMAGASPSSGYGQGSSIASIVARRRAAGEA